MGPIRIVKRIKMGTFLDERKIHLAVIVVYSDNIHPHMDASYVYFKFVRSIGIGLYLIVI